MVRTGKVVSCDNNKCNIEFVKMEACENCGACKLSHEKAHIFLKGDYAVGSFVDVSLPNKQFLLATAIAYMLPLLCMLFGLAIGYYLPILWESKGTDFTTLIGGIIGLTIALLGLFINEKTRKGHAPWEPYVVGIVEDPSESNTPTFSVNSVH